MVRVQDNDWDKIVGRVLEDTEAGAIKWVAHAPKDVVPPVENDNVKGLVYEAQLLGKTLRVYGYEYRRYTDEDDWYTATEVSIELVSDGLVAWSLPPTERRRVLLDELARNVAGADTWATNLLASPKY